MVKKKTFIFPIVLMVAVIVFLFLPMVLVIYCPELTDKIDDLVADKLNPPPSLKELRKLEELEKIEPTRGKIAFHSKREGDDCTQIYTVKIDGSEPVSRLTSGGGEKLYPQFSPNGKMIAFTEPQTSFSPGALPAKGLYIIGADGSLTIKIYNGAIDRFFAWSPDNKQIAFSLPDWTNKTSDMYEGSEMYYDTECAYDIYAFNLDNHNLTRLTTEGGRYPTWSPDGKKIGFVSTRYQNNVKDNKTMQDIYIMNSDGSNQTRIPIPLPYDGNNFAPSPLSLSWSPDGKKFAFWAWWGNPRIFTINTDGSNLTRLDTASEDTPDNIRNARPKWSPDGKKIAFDSVRGGRGFWSIYIMNADGSDIKILVDDPRAEYPTWSPP